MVNQLAIRAVAGKPGCHQQPADLTVERLFHLVRYDSLVERVGAIKVAGVRFRWGQQLNRRLHDRGVSRRERHAHHPGLTRRLLIDPVDRRIDRISPSISSRANVRRGHLLDRPIFIVDRERRNVVPTERGEVDVAGSRTDARLIWIEDTAGVAAYTTRSLRPGFRNHCASVVGAVASARIRAAMVRIADEAA